MTAHEKGIVNRWRKQQARILEQTIADNRNEPELVLKDIVIDKVGEIFQAKL